MIEFPAWFRLVAATTIGLPLLQSLIYVLGATASTILLNQFSWDGTNRDSWSDLIFAVVVLGFVQGFWGFLCGLSTSLALLMPSVFRRAAVLSISALGVLVYAWLLSQNWNFMANNGDATSPLNLDFQMVTFFGLPWVWYLSVFCLAFFARSLEL